MQVKIITEGHKHDGKKVALNTVIDVHDSVGEWLVAENIAQKYAVKTTANKSSDKTENE